MIRFGVFFWVFLFLSSCASSGTTPAKEYYTDGMKAIQEDSSYPVIVSHFEQLVRFYPQSPYARQAYLELINFYYLNRQYSKLQTVSERFLAFYSDDPRQDYAEFMRAVALFEESFNQFDVYIYTDLNLRDFEKAETTFKAFSDFIQLYPKSPYAANARKHLLYIRNRLAAREINVGRYYLTQRKNYVAAIERGQYVLENLVSSSHVKEAIQLIVDAYLALNERKEASTYQKLLDSVSH